jgi:hypothetical protein
LDDALCVRTVIWLDECGWICCQNGRRECEGVEIGTFRYGSILEDNQQAGIVSPFNLEPSADVFPLGKGSLDVPCFELLGKAGQGQNTSYRGRKTRGGSRRHVFDENAKVAEKSGDEREDVERESNKRAKWGLVRVEIETLAEWNVVGWGPPELRDDEKASA